MSVWTVFELVRALPAPIGVSVFSPVPCGSSDSVGLAHTPLHSLWRNLCEHRHVLSSGMSQEASAHPVSVCGVCVPAVRVFLCVGGWAASEGCVVLLLDLL